MNWDIKEKNNLHKHAVSSINVLLSYIKSELDYNKVEELEASDFLSSIIKAVMIKNNLKIDDNVLALIGNYVAKTLKKNNSN